MERRLAAQQAPAETIDDADHRVKRIEQAPFLRHDAAAETDWRDVKPELHDERNDVTEVAILNVEGAEPEAGAESAGKGQGHERRQEQQVPVWEEVVPEHKPAHEDQCNKEIDEAGNHRAGGDNQSWEIDFGNEVGIADKAVARFAQRRGKELPGEHGAHHQQGVGDGDGRWEMGEASKDQSKNYRGDERSDDSPGDANDRLFVADQNIAPGQEVEEFAVTPKIEVVGAGDARGRDEEVHRKC